MTAQSEIEILRDVDRFYKNLHLLFDDLTARLTEKTLLSDFQVLTESSRGWTNAVNSEICRHLVFEHEGKIYFAGMLAKAEDHILSKNSPSYKHVCAQLRVNPLFPLLLVTGSFEPSNPERFKNDSNMRWLWVYYTLLLRVPLGVKVADPSVYRLNAILDLPGESEEGWWSVKSRIKIRKLSDIVDSNVVDSVAAELLSF